jgi:hypothetical protein
MKRTSSLIIGLACLFLSTALVGADAASDANRVATREKLREALDTAGARLNIKFKQSSSQPFNFVGVMDNDLTNAESLEIVIGVTAVDTIGFRVYPHYKGGYINIDKAKDSAGLMRQLLSFCGTNFLFWGIDDTNDVFSGYTITLESGFPKEAVQVVLNSIHNTDGFVAKLRPFVDGPAAEESK